MSISREALKQLEDKYQVDLFIDTDCDIYDYPYVSIDYKNYKLPKKFTLEWLENKIQKILGGKTGYINISQILNMDMKINAYPASYGIGISNIYNHQKDEMVNKIKSIFDKMGIQYKLEYSMGMQVLRIVISKSKDNIEKLKNLKELKL